MTHNSKKLEWLTEKVEAFIDEHNLDHGNASVDIEEAQHGNSLEMYVVFEAPQNTTLTVSFEVDDLALDDDNLDCKLKELFSQRIDEHDPSDYFEEIWTREFGESEEFGAFAFMDMLKSDAKFFDRVAKEWAIELTIKQASITFGLAEKDIFNISEKANLSIDDTIRYIKNYAHNILNKREDILGVYFYNKDYTQELFTQEANQWLDISIEIANVEDGKTTLVDYFIDNRGIVVDLADGRIIYVVDNGR